MNVAALSTSATRSLVATRTTGLTSVLLVVFTHTPGASPHADGGGLCDAGTLHGLVVCVSARLRVFLPIPEHESYASPASLSLLVSSSLPGAPPLLLLALARDSPLMAASAGNRSRSTVRASADASL